MNDIPKSIDLSQRIAGRNLYLIGMMGSGKTDTGPFITEALGYSFIDVDQVIEKVAKNSIAEIFKEQGEEVFRGIETQVLKEIGKRHSLVVATGGGIVTRPENWGILHQGIVIWLNPVEQELVTRLKLDSNRRPLLDKNNIEESITSVLRQRRIFYSEADLNIKINKESPQEVASKVLEKLSVAIKEQENQGESQTIE